MYCTYGDPNIFFFFLNLDYPLPYVGAESNELDKQSGISSSSFGFMFLCTG